MVSSPSQLIDRQGHFKEDNLKSFLAQTKFPGRSKSYSVVSIVGPKSSGKSTLLNQLFGTNFKVRDTFRQLQTTQGIWMAKVDGIQPFTIAEFHDFKVDGIWMDIEGTDGRVKEGNTTFDKQSALFALEISNVVLINMWWHDLGRDEAACRPLLKIIFQFMVQHFKPRRRTLLFVLRDKKTKFSLKDIEAYLKDDIQKIWDRVLKPDAHKKTPLSNFFKVEIIALSSCDHNKRFEQEVAALRQRFFSSASTSQGGQVAADRRVVSASDFSNHARMIWKRITQIPDLKISSVQKMASTTRCDEIIKRKLAALPAAKLRKAIHAGPKEFAKELRTILKTCNSEYDEETKYYDEGIRTAKRKELEAKAFERLRPAYDAMLKHLFVKAFESFITGLNETVKMGIDGKKDFAASVDTSEQSCVGEFEKGCKDAAVGRANWDASPDKRILIRTMKTLASFVKSLAKSQGNGAQLVLGLLSAAGQVAGLAATLAGGAACNIM